MAMDSFSYIDSVRAAFTSCLPCLTTSRSDSTSNSASHLSNPASNAAHSELRPPLTSATSTSFNDLEHLLHDADSDALSLHSNLGGASAHRRAKHRRQPKFSLTLFGYTLFGRPPIYLSDDEEADDVLGDGGRRTRALATTSSSTLDSDAAPLDASTIERLSSPDHFATLAAQRECETERLRLEVEEEARRKAERRARRRERKARERAGALLSYSGTPPPPDTDTLVGFQGSRSGPDPTSVLFQRAVKVPSNPPVPGRVADFDDSISSHSGDADDADLDGELYTQKKKPSVALSASGSDSRSRTSASFSAGDASHTQTFPIQSLHQSIPYPHTEMHFPAPAKKMPRRTSKRTSTVSSVTSQSTSTAPYTPVESVAGTPAVAAFPVPQERYIRDGIQADFPSMGLSGKRNGKTLDPRAFLAQQG